MLDTYTETCFAVAMFEIEVLINRSLSKQPMINAASIPIVLVFSDEALLRLHCGRGGAWYGAGVGGGSCSGGGPDSGSKSDIAARGTA